MDTATFIQTFKNKDRWGLISGWNILSLSKTELLAEYPVDPEHFNPNKTLHGGALFSVMDSSQGMFVHFILDDIYRYAATGKATIHYLAPVTQGMIRIRTWLKGRERRKFFIESSATNEAGLLVATLEEIWIGLPKA